MAQPLIEVATAAPADAARIVEILRRSIVEVCGPDYTGSPAFVEAWLRNKTRSNVRAWIESPGSWCVVASQAGRIEGAGLLGRDGEVRLCYVSPEAVGSGIGAALMGAIERRARDWGLERLFASSTVTALGFYLSRGFVRSGAPSMDGARLLEQPIEMLLREPAAE